MRQGSAGLALLCAVVWMIGCNDTTAPNGSDGGTLEWSGQVAAGDQVEVKGISGDITFRLSTGTQVEVAASKTSQDDDIDEVTVEVVEHAGGVTICAVYPNVPGQPANECLPGDRGNLSSEQSDVQVNFTIDVPAGITLVGRTIAGTVSAENVENDAFLSTIAGNIVLSTTEIGEGSTISGNVTATIGSASWGQDLAFQVITGNVTVTIPANTNAVVEATVITGSIDSDFTLTQVSPVHRQGTLGTGGPTLTLSTVTGNLTLLSGS
jgi:DUF4097 and DUF4098 domain-containing protein YvlB